MKKTKSFLKNLIIMSFLSIFVGCHLSTHYIQTGSRNYEETIPDAVKIYSGEPQEEYIVIGSIAVDYVGNSTNTMTYLKEKAAELGADAVIQTKLTSIITNAKRLGANGVAVKFKK